MLWLHLIHLAATWAMVGLIWFVQVVHYPLFNMVGEAGFAAYEHAHQNRTSFVVIPLMFAELGAAAVLCLMPGEGVPRWSALVGLAMVVGIWASTFLLSVPQHTVLSEGFDERAHTMLVVTNWVRTVLWSARGGLAIWMLVRFVE